MRRRHPGKQGQTSLASPGQRQSHKKAVFALWASLALRLLIVFRVWRDKTLLVGVVKGLPTMPSPKGLH
uniref:Secreted protein n=1 Tax=Panagrellus redivivus TaxID=6233 RepID=A0A7E4VVN9_PANRE